MLFNSFDFFVFLAVLYPIYFASKLRVQNIILLIASYTFYATWDWRFLGLILVQTIVDYFIALAIDRQSVQNIRKLLLLVSVCVNLSILGFFKYYNFFAESLVQLFALFNLEASWTTLKIILPVGISFYTLKTLSYTIDVYRRGLHPTRNFIDYALFVSFFPQLLAGPIERARNLLPQIIRERHFSNEEFARGCYLILLGLFKKVAIADATARYVNEIYANTYGVSSIEVLLATFLFTVQIYCDFSGYTDIARGVAKTLGFNLMVNFHLPYFSKNPQEFWRRWHISLSTWLRDYLYIPLGGNRHGNLSTLRNLMLTMILGGLWHGAALNFIFWGFYHGLLLVVHRYMSKKIECVKSIFSKITDLLKILFFFFFVCYGWLIFKAQSSEQILSFTISIFNNFTFENVRLPMFSESLFYGLPALLLLELIQSTNSKPTFYLKWPFSIRCMLYSYLILMVILGTANAPAEFIYFQF